MRICIDPGHGGNDSGAPGPTGLKESDTNLAVAFRLGKLLEAAGQVVIMTRRDDTFIQLAKRCDIANGNGADYFISLHCNSDGRDAAGIETLVYSMGSAAAALASAIQRALIWATNDKDRGIKPRPDLAVLRGTHMPACLVELGFISNPSFEAAFRDTVYLDTLASAVFSGLAAYLHLEDAPPDINTPGEDTPFVVNITINAPPSVDVRVHYS